MSKWIAAGLVVNYVVGVLSSAYWWRKEFGLTAKDFVFCLLVGGGGPLIWVVGWHLHNKDNKKDFASLD